MNNNSNNCKKIKKENINVLIVLGDSNSSINTYKIKDYKTGKITYKGFQRFSLECMVKN